MGAGHAEAVADAVTIGSFGLGRLFRITLEQKDTRTFAHIQCSHTHTHIQQ